MILTSCTQIATPTINPIRQPVYMSIPSIEQDFPLVPRPGDLPYESGMAFWRFNSYALDVSSHCTETPGKFFDNIKIGNSIVVTYDDGSIRDFIVTEIIIAKYESPSDPLNHDWIEQSNGKHYTLQEFSNYIMIRKNTLVLHSSLCSGGISFGQTFYIAQ